MERCGSIENCQAQAPFGGPERVGLHKGVDADRGRSEQSNRNQTEGQMDHRSVRILGAFVVAVAVALVVIPVAAQSGKADAKARAEAWTPPRGADGHVDLSGVWSHNAATPFERPKELEGRELLTDQEVENLKRNAAELFNGDTDAAFGDSVFLAALRKNDKFKSTDTTGNYNHFWLVDREFDNRTSLFFFASSPYARGHRRADVFVLKRLANAAERTFLPGSDRGVEGRVRSDHNDHRLSIELQKFFERPQTAYARHRHVEQHYVVRTTRIGVQAFFAGLGQVDAIALRRKQRLEHVAHDLFVVDDQY